MSQQGLPVAPNVLRRWWSFFPGEANRRLPTCAAKSGAPIIERSRQDSDTMMPRVYVKAKSIIRLRPAQR